MATCANLMQSHSHWEFTYMHNKVKFQGVKDHSRHPTTGPELKTAGTSSTKMKNTRMGFILENVQELVPPPAHANVCTDRQRLRQRLNLPFSQTLGEALRHLRFTHILENPASNPQASSVRSLLPMSAI